MRRASDSRFPWLLWLLAGAAVIALGFWLDGRVNPALDATGKPELKRLAWWCSKAGDGGVVAAVGFTLAAVFFFLNHPRWAARIFSVTGAALLIGLCGIIIRSLIGRTRPSAEVVPGFYGVWHDGQWIIGKYAYSSLPSGHSALAAGLACAVWLLHRGWGTVVWIYALAVMWSRIAQRSHHFSDVLASAVLAVPLAWLIKKHLAPTVEFQFDNFYRAWKRK